MDIIIIIKCFKKFFQRLGFSDLIIKTPGLLDVEILKNEYLNEIQKKLSAVFCKYKEIDEIPKFFRTHKQLYNSYQNFGFPFVGEHWIPHFTISSLKVAKNHKIIRDFLLDQINICFTVNTISIWDI